MVKRLVLVGGGHAHLHALSRLRELRGAGIAVSLVCPGPYLYYSGMGPGLLSGRYAPGDVRFDVRAMARLGGAVFLAGQVAAVDAAERRLRLADGRDIPYDAASFGLGSVVARSIPTSGSPDTVLYPVKPIENLLAARRDIESRVEAGSPVRVVIAGGGAAGFEIAGNVLALLSHCGLARPQVAVAVGPGLLGRWPARARRLARWSLERRGARLLPARVEGVEDGAAVLSDGTREPCEVVFAAMGTRPPGLFAQSGLPAGPDGGLLVNAFLQCPFFPELFGGGDCIHFGPQPLAKAGVYAVRQGPVLFANLLAFLAGRPLTAFRRTGSNYLAILNSGDGRAILRQGPVVLEGEWVMRLKDLIDRRFMRSFPTPP